MPAMLMADRVYRMEGGRIVEEDRDEAVLTYLENTETFGVNCVS
jgi:hypothetical protein